ncbi:CLVS1 [Cervus elaphus hippelaphus]|uniref:Clavesin-1 n=1 Tax=Cervus elaphus hippelaphus TaxID=46360 RepID=A0A212CEX9_CEREH|nr:CLVS1 [Cervus elaphus hippelaphus]
MSAKGMGRGQDSPETGERCEQRLSPTPHLALPRLSPLLRCHGCGVSALRCVDSSHLQSLRTPSLSHPTLTASVVHPPPGARSACAPYTISTPIPTITVMISTITSAVTTVNTTVSCHLDKAGGPQDTGKEPKFSGMKSKVQAGLSPETIEKARLELNENPDVLHQDIQQVRDMIITRPDIGFLRTDDAFILRFLRARKFHQADAFRLLAQYFQYRQLNLDMFKNFKADDPGIKRALIDGFPGVLENRDHYGRKILLLFAANWDQSRNSFTDILRAILLSLEVLIEDPELQINGFILIIDWSNFSFKQASKLTPSILKLAIEGLQDSFPARFGGVHFVNQPWYIHALYTLIKPFLKDKTRKRIFLHGNNLNSLHQLIHPEFLPSEFGGTLPPYDMGTWARTLLGPDYSDENDYTHTSYNAMHAQLHQVCGGVGQAGRLPVGLDGPAQDLIAPSLLSQIVFTLEEGRNVPGQAAGNYNTR